MPTLNGQILGQASRATGALLERVLDGLDAQFHHWVALNQTILIGGTIERADLIQRMVDGLKITADAATEAVAGAVAAGLLIADGQWLVASDTGQTRHREIVAVIGQLTEKLYGDIPADDLETAGRVLTTLIERANRELAAA